MTIPKKRLPFEGEDEMDMMYDYGLNMACILLWG